MMTLSARIDALVALGQRLAQPDDFLNALMQRTTFHNGWLTLANQQQALTAIVKQMLQRDKLESWLQDYDVPDPPRQHTVGLILAGNIPLVGFHDVLCVFVAGHRAQIKLSEKDLFVFPYLIKLLGEIDPATAEYFTFVERLQDFTAVIATGSNNSARYFHAYFGKYPHIIRQNRNGVAVLTGTETAEELHELGKDIFTYYGMGCRNVAKVYLPQGYTIDTLLEALHEYRNIVLNNKFKNNFDYHYALYLLNRVDYRANGCIIMTEHESVQSPIANLYYSYYDSPEELLATLHEKAEEIQVVVGKADWLPDTAVPFGKAQQPELADYADGVDTLAFLIGLD